MGKNQAGLISFLEKIGKTNQHSWQELASMFGYSKGETVRNLWLNHRRRGTIAQKVASLPNYKEVELQNIIAEQEELIIDINKRAGTAAATFITKEVLSDEEVYAECKMDPEKWVLTRIWHKKRATGFAYSANFELIKVDVVAHTKDNFKEFLAGYKSSFKPISKSDLLVKKEKKDKVSVFISLTDAHIDKGTIDQKTLESKCNKYLELLDTLVMQSYNSFNIDEIVYVIGNDFFNTDTFFNTTTNGTQQFNNAEWDQAYEAGFDLQVKAINMLKLFCNTLHIKFVPGNHDRTKGFFLVHALETYFKADKNIIFDRNSDNTKVYIYGENFIGMHHGDTEPKRLPLYFASKYYKEWGTAKFKEIGLGDKHHKKSWIYKTNLIEDEFEGVRLFQTPSFGGLGQWDKQKLFDNSIQSGMCRIYNKHKGKVGEFEDRIL